MSKFRLLSPAAAPIPGSAVLSALRSSPDDRELTKLLSDLLNVRYVFAVSSGRAALAIVVKALKELSERREVVIPAYTCFSVPAAVVRAGLVIRLCEVDSKTLDLDQNALARIDLGKALSIVPSSLYGMPADLVFLEKIARAHGVFLVDDAAQSFGSTLGGKSCGTFGDAGFYSLGRGKNVSTMGGGVIVTKRDEIAHLLQSEVNTLPRPSSANIVSSALSSLVYAVMLTPSRYWLLDRIPFIGLGLSVFDPNFEMTQLSLYQERLAAQLFPLLEAYNRIRQANADQLREGISGFEGIEIPQPVNGATPVYLRFPILARDGKHRARLINRLKAAGIGASTSYPTAIGDIPGISCYLTRDQQPCPSAASIAKRIVTLPTHPYVTVADVGRMIDIVRAES